MGSEHNMADRLPEPPAPSPEAREAAIARALQQFDRLHQETARASGPSVVRAAGTPRGRTTLARPSVRYLAAASVAAFIAVPVGWLYLKDAQQLETRQTASKADREAGTPVPPAEPTTRSVGDRIGAAAPPAPTAPAPSAAFAPPAAPAPSLAPASPAAPAQSAAPAQPVAPAPGAAQRSEPRPAPAAPVPGATPAQPAAPAPRAAQRNEALAPAAPPAPLARQQAPAALATSPGDLGACSGGDVDRKITGCTRIIEDRARGTADRRQALLERGMAYAQRREFDRAIGDFTESIRLDPGNAAAFYNRSLAYRAKGEHDRARADCAQASGLNSGYRSRC